MEDVIKTIKAQLYDRATSPLSGAFIISWCLWNWRVLVILFSDMPVDEKFIYIDTKIFITSSDLILNSMVYPLIPTLLIIFLYPWPARFVYEYSRVQQRKLKEIQQKIEDEEPLTKEQAREIKANVTEKESRFENTLNRKDEKIQVLENLNKELQKYNETNDGLIETSKNNIKQQAERIEELEADNAINEVVKNIVATPKIDSRKRIFRKVRNQEIATPASNSIKAHISSEETNTALKAIEPLKPTVVYSAAEEASRKFGSLLGSEAEKITMSEIEKLKSQTEGHSAAEEFSRSFGSRSAFEEAKNAITESEKFKNLTEGYSAAEELGRSLALEEAKKTMTAIEHLNKKSK